MTNIPLLAAWVRDRIPATALLLVLGTRVVAASLCQEQMSNDAGSSLWPPVDFYIQDICVQRNYATLPHRVNGITIVITI